MKNFIFLFLVLILSIPCIAQQKVLVVVSSESEFVLQDGQIYHTGYYFNELTVPAMHLAEAGYELVIANPKGNKPPMDKSSDTVSYFSSEEEYLKAKEFHASLSGLEKAMSLREVIDGGLDQYSGIFFPGGHAPMIDLARSHEVGEILHHFHQNQKPTALICHGPIALLGAIKNCNAFVDALNTGDVEAAQELASSWLYKDYQMTIFSTPEEKFAEENLLKHGILYYPQDGLKAAGGKVAVGPEWQSHVVQDRELITAQNPGSDKKFVALLLDALAK